MSSIVRIVKGGADNGSSSSLHADDLKTQRQVTRAMAETVKSWITETKQHRRNEERRLARVIK